MAAVIRDCRQLQTAAELFSAEHEGMSIGMDSPNTPAPAVLVRTRLLEKTDAIGFPNSPREFGPYLDKIPVNQLNSLDTIRVDGLPAGAGLHGWRVNSATGKFLSDHTS